MARYVCANFQFCTYCHDYAIEVIRLALIAVKHTVINLTVTEIAGNRDLFAVQLIYFVDEFIDC